jgi:lactoylglutathione lyase
MKISHIAVWVSDIEKMKVFYERYFNARAGEKYINPRKGFQSCFLSFVDGAQLELMHRDSSPGSRDEQKGEVNTGFIHIAISVGSENEVDALTKTLSERGITVLSAPRCTGDGFYESTVLDPEGNIIEITV